MALVRRWMLLKVIWQDQNEFHAFLGDPMMRTMEVESGIDEGHVSREKEQNLDEGPW